MMTPKEKDRLFISIAALSSVFVAYQLMGVTGIVLSVSIIFIWSKW
jgi:hypothetical protein